MIDIVQGYRVGDVDATGILLLEDNVGRALVDADSEALQFRLDDALVRQRLVDIQDDEDKVARLCDGDDLTTSSFAILGTLNDTRQVENLDLCAVVNDLSGNGCELYAMSVSPSRITHTQYSP